MRELSQDEIAAVSGGNMFVYGAISIVGAYEAGKAFGGYVAGAINSSFSMSTGEAAYHTVQQFKS